MSKVQKPVEIPSIQELNACVSTAGRRKGKSWRSWLFDNQIAVSLGILSAIALIHITYPSVRSHTGPVFYLSYKQPPSASAAAKGIHGAYYLQGQDDIYFVGGAILLFTAVRAMVMDYILIPFAHSLGLKKKAAVRFAEQGWLAIYYGCFWALGMYLWHESNYWLSFEKMLTSWPQRETTGLFKWYYLMQLSFWLQQILVIHLEAPRKDHYQMLVHHILTSTLMYIAYIYRYFPIANGVLCLMDIVDILLPVAKMLKYAGSELICNIMFGVFMTTWLISRHYFYPLLCWTIYKGLPTHMNYGCYLASSGEKISTDPYPAGAEWSHLLWPAKDINGPVCCNPTVKWIFLGFLLLLQGLSIVWFCMIVRVAVMVVRGGSAEDTRSDDEGEDEEEEEEIDAETDAEFYGTSKKMTAAHVAISEKKANGNGSVMNGSTSSSSSSSSSSLQTQQQQHATPPPNVRTRTMRDRKSLLGRIGCDKPS